MVPAHRPPVPVISVGNITVGGTGKTPCVIALARLLCQWRPGLAAPGAIAVLSRGYGRRLRALVAVEPDMDYRECGDEPLLIKRAVPQAQVIVHARRVIAAQHAVRRGARILLLDDGFQHRRLARDLDLVLVDGEQPLGNGYCLPAGPLREPAANLHRASLIVGVGSNNDQAQIFAEAHNKPFHSARIDTALTAELSTNLSTPVLLMTSIANPDRVYNSLIKLGLNIIGRKIYPDHHHFSERDLQSISDTAIACGAVAVLATAKDCVRISDWRAVLPLYAVDAQFIFADPSSLYTVMEPLLAAGVE